MYFYRHRYTLSQSHTTQYTLYTFNAKQNLFLYSVDLLYFLLSNGFSKLCALRFLLFFFVFNGCFLCAIKKITRLQFAKKQNEKKIICKRYEVKRDSGKP